MKRKIDIRSIVPIGKLITIPIWLKNTLYSSVLMLPQRKYTHVRSVCAPTSY